MRKVKPLEVRLCLGREKGRCRRVCEAEAGVSAGARGQPEERVSRGVGRGGPGVG